MQVGPFELGLPQWVTLAVAAQRLGELALARRNTERLLAAGAYEEGAAHYPFLVGLHALWLVMLLLYVPADAGLSWPLLGLFGLLQAARVWVIASLGRFWTTRIITLPRAPLVRRGPYRWVKHPNYLIVALEIPVLPAAFGAWEIALVLGLLNLFMLRWRIRVEETALTPRT